METATITSMFRKAWDLIPADRIATMKQEDVAEIQQTVTNDLATDGGMNINAAIIWARLVSWSIEARLNDLQFEDCEVQILPNADQNMPALLGLAIDGRLKDWLQLPAA